MKTALLRALLPALVALTPSAFSGTAVMKGGIVYWLHTGDSCPGFILKTGFPGHFSIEWRPGVVCPAFQTIPRASYTFVLGPLAPGMYWMNEWDLGPGLEYPFNVPDTTEQLITNLTLNASRQLTFHINGYGTVRYVVQRTYDFQSWSDADIVIGEGDFTEQNPPAADPAFFRIKIVEPPPTILPIGL